MTGESLAYFAQGARNGHCEGRGRAGSYVEGEEWGPADEAARVNAPEAFRKHYCVGFAKGYSLAAEGESLPADLESAALPTMGTGESL